MIPFFKISHFCISALVVLSFGKSLAQDDFVDDLLLRNKFEKGLEAMVEANETVSLANLGTQLSMDHPKVKLLGATKALVSPDTLYEQCRKSVLVVGRLYNCGKCSKWHTSTASGFAVGRNGIMVTNYHVLENGDGETLGAMDYKGRIYAVQKVLSASKVDDLVVLKLREAELTPLPIGSSATVGSDAWVLSHPDRRLYTLTKGMVSRYNAFRENNKNVRRMSITADYAKGSSGAPVLNNNGEVIGVVSSTNSIYYNKVKGREENLQMVVKNCIPINALRRLFKE